MNVAPPSGGHSTDNVPPCAWTIPIETERPNSGAFTDRLGGGVGIGHHQDGA